MNLFKKILLNLFTTNYRVVTDRYLGYEVQIRYWWFPLRWYQCHKQDTTNTFLSEIQAIEWLNSSKGPKFKSKEIWRQND
jgi:hypothetical protein